ncbi:glycosyltransferase family 4 protein [Metabacillus sp. SLBN-84]
MKVLMIGSHLRVTGGITTVLRNYEEAGLSKKVNLEHLPTYLGSKNVINILYFVLQYCRLVFKLFFINRTYDVAHIHMSYRGSFIRKMLIINLLHKKNIPIILHMHGSQFEKFYNESSIKMQNIIKSTLNKTTLIIALGDQWKKYYEGLSTAKVVSLDNAVFPKKESDKDTDKLYISTMGILSERKGTYDLIEAASKIKGQINPEYKFLIAGDGEIDKVKRKIKDLNLEDMFVIPGWISDQSKIEEIYRNSILYVLPSYNEGMPMSVLEAMSYGLPVITTNVGSITSVVDEENGFILKPGDIDSLAECLLFLLNNTSLHEKYKKNNMKKIEEKYNIFRSVDKIVSLYNSVNLNKSK